MTKTKMIGLFLAVAVGLVLLLMPTPEGLTGFIPPAPQAGASVSAASSSPPSTPPAVVPQRVLAIISFTVVLWAFGVVNTGIASILMIALLIVAGVPALDVPVVNNFTNRIETNAGALSGFSQPSWWTLVAVLYYGCAMKGTGLA